MIRKGLMLGNRRLNIDFVRSINFQNKSIQIINEISFDKKTKFKKLSFGDDFFVRYVPQSRYFQSQELFGKKIELDNDEIKKINRKKYWSSKTTIKLLD